MQEFTSPFLFAACAPDCQDLVKHELVAQHGLRLAFSRPGLLTFKAERPLTWSEAPLSRVAILSGLSVGAAKTLPELVELVRLKLLSGSHAETRRAEPSSESSLVGIGGRYAQRAWTHRAYPWPTEENEAGPSEDRLTAVSDSLERAFPLETRRGDFELGVLVPAEARANFGYFAFARPEGAQTLPARVLPPPEAPSRAYSKLVEAVTHFRLPLRAGEGVLELGAAPGGATFALLELGLSVVAVDPAEMDARLAPFADGRGLTLHHLKKPAQALESADLSPVGAPLRWLVSDMNVAPPLSAHYVLRARALMKTTLRGAILTLKLNDTAAVDTLPRVLRELERAFGRAPRVAHLPSHRREVVVVFSQAHGSPASPPAPPVAGVPSRQRAVL